MRRDGEAQGLVVVALYVGVDKERKVRRYLERHQFKFTTLMKTDPKAETPFGIKLAGSTALIGADGKVVWRGIQFDAAEVRRRLSQLPK